MTRLTPTAVTTMIAAAVLGLVTAYFAKILLSEDSLGRQHPVRVLANRNTIEKSRPVRLETAEQPHESIRRSQAEFAYNPAPTVSKPVPSEPSFPAATRLHEAPLPSRNDRFAADSSRKQETAPRTFTAECFRGSVRSCHEFSLVNAEGTAPELTPPSPEGLDQGDDGTAN